MCGKHLGPYAYTTATARTTLSKIFVSILLWNFRIYLEISSVSAGINFPLLNML